MPPENKKSLICCRLGFRRDLVGRRGHELADGDDERADGLIVARDFAFHLGKLFGELLVTGDPLTKVYKSPHDKDADLDGPRRIEDAGGHNGAVLGEGIGPETTAAPAGF